MLKSLEISFGAQVKVFDIFSYVISEYTILSSSDFY